MNKVPSLWIIAGPNGVGKTTFALKHIATISGTVEFINQDEIARGLYPLAPTGTKALLEAGKVAAHRKIDLIRHQVTFSVETTLSGRSYLKTIQFAKSKGYTVNLLYFYVSNIEESIRRVHRRVETGGHDVPVDVIHRRFPRSLSNFHDYADQSDHWSLFNNDQSRPRIVAEKRDAKILVIDQELLNTAPSELKERITANQQFTENFEHPTFNIEK